MVFPLLVRMKRVLLLLGIVILLLVLIPGCTEQTASRSYTNETYGFSLDPPEGWQEMENEPPTVAVWFTPVNSSDVSLRVDVPFILSEGRALSTFADQAEENLSENAVNYTILSRDWRSLPSLQAYEIAYVYDLEGAMMYVKQVAVLRTRSVFVITFTAPYSISGVYLSAVDQSIDSFQ